jgi:serine/threonine-protein kinase
MMKLPHVSADEEEDEDEIDYDALLAGTPIGGTQTQVVTPPTNAGPLDATVAQHRPTTGSMDEASIATMQFDTGNNGLPAGSANFGRYQVLEAIGQGAMGMVYKGLDPAIDRPVALKTIRLDNIVNSSEMHELKERLDREAKAAGQLSHPNIVTIYDVGEEQSMQYIAMEFLDGNTLEALIDNKQQWDYKTLCKLMIQICEALDFAHERGIVHRDIKPANIMMLDGDRVKVMDFGIARLDQSNMTQSGVALGTPNYISPEQLKGQGIDRRSDIFSLGVVFYEMLTQQKPFKGDTISALIYSILHTNPPAPSEINLEVPRIFDKIVAKALAKDPDLRFQTSREMADILRKLI